MAHGGALNDLFEVRGHVSVKDGAKQKASDLLGKELADAFNEGATCLAVSCYNAAATMFRLCVDLATRPLLPDPQDASRPQPNAKQRRDLGLRLPWLFDNGLLDPTLRGLAGCIKEDGNDGAHTGNLSQADAEDICDFTNALLDRLVIEPKRIELAEKRRQERRQPKAGH